MGKKGGGKKQQQDDADFDSMLKELQTKTKEAGMAKQKQAEKHHKAAPRITGTVDKNTNFLARHQDMRNKLNKAKEDEFDQAMQRQSQQQKIQQLLAQMQQMGGMNGMGGMEGLQNMYSPFLMNPKTDIATETKDNHLFDVATCDMQGWRKEMEDSHFNELDFSAGEKCGLFGVFDGHSGKKVAQIAKTALPALVKQHYDATKLDTADFFFKVYAELDIDLKDKAENSGATAVVAMISEKYITCASVGDSRAVLCRDGKAVTLSYDHKPENDEERARIEAGGGHVANNRVNGELAMSRAIGDFRYKEVEGKSAEEQLVIAVPELHTVERSAKDQFVVVACDGIFDVLTNEEVVEFVLENRPQCKDVAEVCEKLLNRCLAPGEDGRPERSEGTDNMTCSIIELKA